MIKDASEQPFHATTAADLAARWQLNAEQGLSPDQVERQRAMYGWNRLAARLPEPWWRKLAEQFNSLVVWILIVAAGISGLLQEWPDALAILAIVLLNGILGYLQEAKAEQALAALARMSSPRARVLRQGRLRPLPAEELVPGDVVEIEAGDHVPADVRLLHTTSFRTQEAALTGESTPVDKDAQALLAAETALGDRRNMAYQGAVAAAGRARGLVVAIGMNTELGRIAGLLDRGPRQPTPLQVRLHELGRVLVVVCLALVSIVFAVNLARGGNVLEVFLLSVSLAVAAIPEGLPAVVTLALALGLQRMVRRNALVRKLPSVETLGSVTVICSDKTGTLTRNEMTVREILAGSRLYGVTGAGYGMAGDFVLQNAATASPVRPAEQGDLMQALAVGALCNNAQLRVPPNDGDEWSVVGDPTEGALLVAARKAGFDYEAAGGRVIAEIPFDSQRKAMSVVASDSNQRRTMYTKGAPEVVLAMCSHFFRDGAAHTLEEPQRAAILQTNRHMAARALRVLALAFRRDPPEERGGYAETNLVFAGLAGMIDPPREEAKRAVATCKRAGIRAVMITGDHPDTALAIARELGIASEQGRALSGRDLDGLDAAALLREVELTDVYARVSAEHKLRVVQAWQRRGQVVAMTGDGVNDAPAVQAADIGIAMGLAGADVTKEASDMVLMDDNFASIVSAVEEGRGIFDNIQKFVHYLLACNSGEVLLMFGAAVVGWPAPLLPIQILWINLVTDGLPALALGLERPEPDIMTRPPRPPRSPVISWGEGLRILGHGTLLAAAAAMGFALVRQWHPDEPSRAQAAAFCIMAFSQLAFSFACRSHRYTLPELGAFSNPLLLASILISGLLQLAVVLLPAAQGLFGTAAQFGGVWWLVAGLSLAPVTIVEVAKLVRAYWRKK